MIKEFALQWPVLRQILHGKDGTGPEAMSGAPRLFVRRMRARRSLARYVLIAQWVAVS